MREVTFISGATGGIGRAFAFECARKGHDLFLTGRSEERLKNLKEELCLFNVNVDFCSCDLTSEEEREKLYLYAKEKCYTFDRIILVAGVDIQKPFLEYTREKLLFQLRVNAEATIDLTHALLSLRAKETEVVAISSMSCVSPMPYFQIYSATKGLILSFFTALRYELKGEGVKITTVMPGGVPTRKDIIEDIKGQGLWGKLSSKSPEFVVRGSLKAVKKNKAKYIPGFFNKFLYFIMKIAPKKIVLNFIAKRWKKLRKDAF